MKRFLFFFCILLPFINPVHADSIYDELTPLHYDKQCNKDIQYSLQYYEIDRLWLFQGRIEYDDGGTKINVYRNHFNNDDLKLTTVFCTHTYCAGSIAYKMKFSEQEKTLILVNANYFHSSMGADDPRSYRQEGSAAFIIQGDDICYLYKDKRKCQKDDGCIALRRDGEDFGAALRASIITISDAIEDYKKDNFLKIDEIEPDP